MVCVFLVIIIEVFVRIFNVCSVIFCVVLIGVEIRYSLVESVVFWLFIVGFFIGCVYYGGEFGFVGYELVWCML